MVYSTSRFIRWALPVLLVTGCGGDQIAPPDNTDALTDPPDLSAIVFQKTRRSGATPAGFITQYELWIGPAGSPRPDAGLVLGEKTPVFQRLGADLRPATAAAIGVGDLIDIWREPGAAYGAVQAPPGAPAYYALQVVVSRP
jgi:hypothetical protein